ncbi:MAG: hypothetical protein HQL99_00510 [Magnetococcales bacterium]|nr:hypothetical protein [Magnetococcales bacterium]
MRVDTLAVDRIVNLAGWFSLSNRRNPNHPGVDFSVLCDRSLERHLIKTSDRAAQNNAHNTYTIPLPRDFGNALFGLKWLLRIDQASISGFSHGNGKSNARPLFDQDKQGMNLERAGRGGSQEMESLSNRITVQRRTRVATINASTHPPIVVDTGAQSNPTPGKPSRFNLLKISKKATLIEDQKVRSRTLETFRIHLILYHGLVRRLEPKGPAHPQNRRTQTT